MYWEPFDQCRYFEWSNLDDNSFITNSNGIYKPCNLKHFRDISLFSKTCYWKFTSCIVITWGIHLSYSSWSRPFDATLYAWDKLLREYVIILLNISWLCKCGTTIYMTHCFHMLNAYSLLKRETDKNMILLMWGLQSLNYVMVYYTICLILSVHIKSQTKPCAPTLTH